MERKHKIPLKLKLIRFKNSDFFSFTDKIIRLLKPPKKFGGVPKKILFIRNDRIGDAVITLPFFRDLKLNSPDIKIHVLASERNKFIFENVSYIDKIIIYSPDNWDESNLNIFFKLPVIGKLAQFIFHLFLPYIFNAEIKIFVDILKNEKYDAVIDLVGRRRNAIIGRMISKYTAGGRLFLLSWLYSYYLETNWVSAKDKDFITRKIECLLAESMDLKILKRDKTLPYYPDNFSDKKEIDIFIHFGTGKVRRFEIEKEIEIIKSLSNYKLIITDGYETENYKLQKEFFRDFPNIEFKIYSSLQALIPDVKKSRLMLAYDGGQTHYLSPYVTVIAIYGPTSVDLWKPYEFENYELRKEWNDNLKVIKSEGEFAHEVIYKRIWCSPCFDIGCEERPCLKYITPQMIKETVENKLTKINNEQRL